MFINSKILPSKIMAQCGDNFFVFFGPFNFQFIAIPISMERTSKNKNQKTSQLRPLHQGNRTIIVLLVVEVAVPCHKYALRVFGLFPDTL